MKKAIIILSMLLGYLLTITAQGVKMGGNSGTADPSAILELESTTKGVLLPRVNLTSTSSSSPISGTLAVGLLVFNQATVNDVVPGFYFWNGAGWRSVTEPPYASGSVFCASGSAAIVDVTNPTTGKTWMDRNLGATQVATSSTDADSYGDLYQWGRGSDGHQCRNSPKISTSSSSDQPGHDDFISTPSDWRSPQNDNLWQGVNGINNPCPSGYRVPTETELDAEQVSWISNDAAGAFASPLQFPMAGRRRGSTGAVQNGGTRGYYWSSTVSSARSYFMYISGSSMLTNDRVNGFAVRCIKD